MAASVAAQVADQICYSDERVQALAEQGLLEIPTSYIRPVEERPSIRDGSLKEVTADYGRLPVIDLAEGGPDVVAQIGQACREWGFFQVVNHGVPVELLERVRQIGAHFYARPLEEKLIYACKDPGTAPEGYGSRLLVKDEQVLDWRDYIDHHALPLSRRDINRWPADPPHYRSTMEEFSDETCKLAQRLLGFISESLGLPTQFLVDAIGEPAQNIVINYYPPCPQPHLTLGLQSHSDMGAITLLLQDDVPGLQVVKDREWFTVEPMRDAFVVNLGDMSQILSNDKYKSCEHRAVVNGERSRLSVIAFYDPAKSKLISPASPLLDKDHPALFPSILYGEHVATWYSKGPDGKKNIDSLVMGQRKIASLLQHLCVVRCHRLPRSEHYIMELWPGDLQFQCWQIFIMQVVPAFIGVKGAWNQDQLEFYATYGMEAGTLRYLNSMSSFVSIGELLLSSLLQPDPAANLGFQDLLIEVTSTEEEDGGKLKGKLIKYSVAITSAFNVPITGCKLVPGAGQQCRKLSLFAEVNVRYNSTAGKRKLLLLQ